ncbi:hypothetical protein R0K05_03240 [Planococcus sp. SIMBA_160]
MSEKVVLTQEQINAIELWLKNYQDKDQLLMIQFFVKVKEADASNEGWIGDYKPMKELSIAQLARAIHVGYEVEKLKFQVGDKVVLADRLIGDSIFTIKNLMPTKILAYEFTNGGWDYAHQLRHATDEEIFWLHELGRDKVPDFREGDVLLHENGVSSPIYGNPGIYLHRTTIESAEIAYQNCDVKGIYPAESFKPFRKEAE